MKNINNSALLTALREVRVAVCGELPTACEYLHKLGIIHIDRYTDAVNIGKESDYHMILVYAPQGEGLFDTYHISKGNDAQSIPIRLLNEPCCHSALLEMKMMILNIAKTVFASQEADDG